MGLQRTHVILPAELIAEIDSQVGPRGRSAFLAEVAKAELRKRRLLTLLNSKEPMWKEEDHPELAEGADKWVRSMRDEWDARADRAWQRKEQE